MTPTTNVFTPEERAALEVGLLAANGALEAMEAVCAEIVDDHHDVTIVREALLTILHIAGAPRALSAFLTLARAHEAKGVPFPELPEDTLPGSPADHVAVGMANMRLVYGHTYDAFARKISRLDGELWSVLLGDAYGRCLGRPAMDLRMRELCIVGALLTIGRAPQILTHMNGALNCGARPEEVEAVLTLADDHGFDVSTARDVWTKIKAKRYPEPQPAGRRESDG